MSNKLFTFSCVMILAVILAFPTSSQGQVNLGVKGGFNYTGNFYKVKDGVQRDFSNLSSFRPSWHVGVFLEFKVSERFGLAPELLFSDNGYNLINSASDPEEQPLHLQYIDLPLIVYFKILPLIYLEGGVEPGIKVNEFFSNQIGPNSRSDAHQDFDFSYLLGVRVGFSESLQVGVRANLGIAETQQINFTDQGGSVINEVASINRLVQLSGYLRF